MRRLFVLIGVSLLTSSVLSACGTGTASPNGASSFRSLMVGDRYASAVATMGHPCRSGILVHSHIAAEVHPHFALWKVRGRWDLAVYNSAVGIIGTFERPVGHTNYCAAATGFGDPYGLVVNPWRVDTRLPAARVALALVFATPSPQLNRAYPLHAILPGHSGTAVFTSEVPLSCSALGLPMPVASQRWWRRAPSGLRSAIVDAAEACHVALFAEGK